MPFVKKARTKLKLVLKKSEFQQSSKEYLSEIRDVRYLRGQPVKTCRNARTRVILPTS
jgi:hypothetical protein